MKALYPLVAICMCIAFTSKTSLLPIGAPIPSPDVKMKDVSGKEISFKDAQKENGLLVMFSCNTCPVVKKYEERTLEIAKYALDKNIGVILLNPNEGSRSKGDSFDDMKEYATKKGYTFSYVIDNDHQMADAFGATRTPEVFLFDKSGKLIYTGAIDDNPNSSQEVSRKHLKMAIDEQIAGKEVTSKTTRSVGCTIKRIK